MKLVCPVCTFKNHELLQTCEMCETPLPKKVSESSELGKAEPSSSLPVPPSPSIPYIDLTSSSSSSETSEEQPIQLHRRKRPRRKKSANQSMLPPLHPRSEEKSILFPHHKRGMRYTDSTCLPAQASCQWRKDPSKIPAAIRINSDADSKEPPSLESALHLCNSTSLVKKNHFSSVHPRGQVQGLHFSTHPPIGRRDPLGVSISAPPYRRPPEYMQPQVKNFIGPDRLHPRHAMWNQNNGWNKQNWKSYSRVHPAVPPHLPNNRKPPPLPNNRKRRRSESPSRRERLQSNRKRRKGETLHKVGCDLTLERIQEIERRRRLKHVILLDLDNWHSFFRRMEKLRDEHKKSFPKGTFLLGYSNGYEFQEPFPNELGFDLLDELRQDPDGGVVIETCLSRKDAADFAICVRFGQLDMALGVQIPITILSGDGGFNELTRCNKRREVYIVNPSMRNANQEDKEQQDVILYTRLISIGEQHHVPESIQEA